MKVSRLPAFLCLIAISLLMTNLSSVIAGEHPWDEDRNTGTPRDTLDTRTTEAILEPGDEGSGTVGTAVFWWGFIWNHDFTASTPAVTVGDKKSSSLSRNAMN
jgi:hypothetical protein